MSNISCNANAGNCEDNAARQIEEYFVISRVAAHPANAFGERRGSKSDLLRQGVPRSVSREAYRDLGDDHSTRLNAAILWNVRFRLANLGRLRRFARINAHALLQARRPTG